MRRSFDIEPIGANLGAEVHGLDLTRPVSQATAKALEDALVTFKIIYARNQHITTAQHLAFGRQFGDLEVHPFRPEGESPEIMVLNNHKDNPVLSTDVWHSDTTFRECPTKYSILRCLIIPPTGGDTIWADMCAAYDGLSDPMKDMIKNLSAVHDFKNFRALFSRNDADQKQLREMERRYPNPSHPVVRTHPVTGKKALFVNSQFTVRLNGFSIDESDSLLRLLYAQAQIPEYQFRLRWKPGTIALWDNPSTQHYAANDYYPKSRRMERVAIVGDRPY
mgnify:CR=1 FL=1